ncbi:unnamed protein product [Rotaria sp. Silwood2]|nr:unnamed protein product [Rotaria sp. Silwood2]
MLYHGVRLSNNEIHKLKTNEGNLISMNVCFSTTLSKSVALTFTGVTNENRYRSHIPDEQENLLDLGATFQILSVIKDNDLYLIKIKAIDEESKTTKEYIELNKQEMKTTSAIIKVCPDKTRIV